MNPDLLRKLSSILLATIVCAGFVALAPQPAHASPPPPPRQPIKVGENSASAQVACGPKYQIRLRFTYDGTTFIDKTLNHGDVFNLPESAPVEAGKNLKAELFVLVKATGAIKAQHSWEGIVSFNGRTGWSLVSGPWADRPYFRWFCIQAQDLYGKWYLSFDGEQHPGT